MRGPFELDMLTRLGVEAPKQRFVMSDYAYSIGVVDVDTDDDEEMSSFEEDISWSVDTAGDWQGHFPDPDTDDFVVTVGSIEGTGTEYVLVSRRYVGAMNVADAARIALDSAVERGNFETDDNTGELIPVYIETGEDEGQLGMPVWVLHVDIVNPSDEDRLYVKQFTRLQKSMCVEHEDCRENDALALACYGSRRENPSSMSTVATAGLSVAAGVAFGGLISLIGGKS